MDSHENNTPAPIDLLAILRRFWKALKKLWLLILLLAILFGALSTPGAALSPGTNAKPFSPSVPAIPWTTSFPATSTTTA